MNLFFCFWFLLICNLQSVPYLSIPKIKDNFSFLKRNKKSWFKNLKTVFFTWLGMLVKRQTVFFYTSSACWLVFPQGEQNTFCRSKKQEQVKWQSAYIKVNTFNTDPVFPFWGQITPFHTKKKIQEDKMKIIYPNHHLLIWIPSRGVSSCGSHI